MANVIHRTTLEFRRSANEPDFPEPEWQHAPDMSAVAGVPRRYWKAPADWGAPGAGPVEMAQAEKDAVDAAILEAARDSTAGQLENLEDIFRAFVLALLDERNRMAQAFNDLKNGVATANNLNDAKTAAQAIADEPIRTVADIKTGVRNKLGS